MSILFAVRHYYSFHGYGVRQRDGNNLSDWQENKGIPIYFGEQSTEYIATSSLEEILNPKKAKELVKKYKGIK